MRSILTVVFAASLLTGCASLSSLTGGSSTSTMRMNVSRTLPAAQGTAKFNRTKNGNTAIDLSVKYLAPPGRLNPPAQTYVAWVAPTRGAKPTNVGALTVDQNLNGSLKTVTPLQTFDLFVTPEASGQVQQPTGEAVLWTSYNGS